LKYRVSLVLVLGLAWALWSGYTDALLVGLGVGSVFLSVFIADRMGLLDEEGAPLNLIRPSALLYLLWLAVEVLKSAIQVTLVVLSPTMPITPRYIRVVPTQRTDFGRALFANSITLTPGTVAVDVAPDAILVHALTTQAADGLLTGDMDARVAGLGGS